MGMGGIRPGILGNHVDRKKGNHNQKSKHKMRTHMGMKRKGERK